MPVLRGIGVVDLDRGVPTLQTAMPQVKKVVANFLLDNWISEERTQTCRIARQHHSGNAADHRLVSIIPDSPHPVACATGDQSSNSFTEDFARRYLCGRNKRRHALIALISLLSVRNQYGTERFPLTRIPDRPSFPHVQLSSHRPGTR